jgi:hypothetical protein
VKTTEARWPVFLEMTLVEYAEEIRREVCGGCPERAPNDSPGKRWGEELPGLVNWVVTTTQRLVEGPAVAGRACEDCTRPIDFLTDLLAEAVEDADRESIEQWQQLRRRLRRPPGPRRTTIRELYQAYEEATGTVLGCD